jgi:flagellar hook-associated protein 2
LELFHEKFLIFSSKLWAFLCPVHARGFCQMGTVGLSFGSPTAGAGINVSQTVSQIVSNLQAVETPWKNQLSTLQTQDTAFSSLGTQLSSLSNDVSQLTDFQGILANKAGSSSDTNILQLTSATSSATAGTHTIVVTSLAQTSSGYIDSVANSNDTLSGAITLQVGSGTAQTINVGSKSNTLSGLSAAINSAGIGVTANVITDANGSRLSLVSGTSGTGGNLTITSSLSDTATSTALKFNTSQTGANANLTVDGVQISNASNTVSNVIPGVTFQLLSYSPGTQVQVVIANDVSSVESVVGAFVSDYNSVISSINTQEGVDSSGNAQPLYGSPTLSLLQEQILGAFVSQNPSGYLDPVKNLTDTLSGSITIQVGSGTAQTITLDSTDNSLSGLAKAINAAKIGVTANIATDATGSYLKLISGQVGTSGQLTITSNLTDATTSTSLNYNNSGGDLAGLTNLGISVNNDGTLALDQTSLTSVLNNDYSGVVAFFQDANSWGQNFSNVLSTTGTASGGLINSALTADSRIESNLNADISREGSIISAQQKSLTLEMNSVNEILTSLPSQLNQANELYSAITGYNSTQNG